MNLQRLSFAIVGTIMFGCGAESQDPGGNSISNTNDWLIPQGQVFDGGPGKDGIPALNNPQMVNTQAIEYLSDNDLVIGFSYNGTYRAYPHNILDWHEIINDNVEGTKISITYCPLTGTGIGWDRIIDGKETTFGVSGLLYNTNLIPYDRLTDSNWCQISMQCVNGPLKGEFIETFPLVETTWKTWKEMYPNSTVVSQSTGFARNYRTYPYGDYRTNNASLLFPVSSSDERLPAKERVLAVIINNKARVYRFDQFEGGTKIISDNFEGQDIIVAGSKDKNFIVAYHPTISGNPTSLRIVQNGNASVLLEDDKGNQFDFLGNAVSGPDQGKTLDSSRSFMAFWFSLGAFYSEVEIFDQN